MLPWKPFHFSQNGVTNVGKAEMKRTFVLREGN